MNSKSIFEETIGYFFLIVVVLALVGPGIYGIYLAFSASIIFGIIALIVQPTPTILGWIAIFGNPDVAKKIAAWLHLPF